LERRGRVGQPERHDQKLKMAMVHAERRLDHVVGVNTNLVIARVKIQLGEESRSSMTGIGNLFFTVAEFSVW
jgi:hypothetical protein